MDLREYLFHSRRSVTEFAKILEISRSYLSHIIHGKYSPSKYLLDKIEKETNGEVKIKKIKEQNGSNTTNIS